MAAGIRLTSASAFAKVQPFEVGVPRLSFEFFDRWSAPMAGAVAAVGVAIVLWRSRRRPSDPGAARARRGGKAQELPCSVCGHTMVFTRRELIPVTPISKGLIVRTFPALSTRKLAEYSCGSCGAIHCFIVEGKAPEWVGANLYQPGGVGSKCMECSRLLRKPPWPAGLYDGRIAEAPQIAPETAMKCGRCGAVVCHGCASKNSFGQLRGGAYRCPRCSRGGITGFFHGT